MASSPGIGRIVAALGITQIIGYGTLYYSFSALAPSMAAEFGWPQEWVYAVLSASLLASGFVAPISGRLADRHGAGRVLAWGSVAATAALILCAMAPGRIMFVLGLASIEIASAFVLYATAFAALSQAQGTGAQRSITHLTLIAGFASTIFWPLTAWLHQHVSWREIYLVYAAVNAGLALPIHVWLAQALRRRQETHKTPEAGTPLPLVSGERHRMAMGMMLAGFALLGFVSSAVLVHMLPMLAALGIGTASIIVTTLFGPAQVLSRIINMQFGRGLSSPALAVIAAALLPAGLVVLVLLAPWAPGAAAFAILFGLGSGLSSIVSGTLPLALFGAGGYGQRLGWISSARLVASAIAPFAFSVVVAGTGVVTALWLVIATGLLSALAFALVWLVFGRSRPAPAPIPAAEAS